MQERQRLAPSEHLPAANRLFERRVLRPLTLAGAIFAATSPLAAGLIRADSSESFSPTTCATPSFEVKPSTYTSMKLGPRDTAVIEGKYDDCGTGPFFWLLACPASRAEDILVQNILQKIGQFWGTVPDSEKEQRRPELLNRAVGELRRLLTEGECLEFEGQAQVGEVSAMTQGVKHLRLQEEQVGRHGKVYFGRAFMLTNNWMPVVVVNSEKVLVFPAA